MSRHICLAATILLAVLYVAEAQRRLALPDPRSCANSMYTCIASKHLENVKDSHMHKVKLNYTQGSYLRPLTEQ
jgi:hypothetical protein